MLAFVMLLGWDLLVLCTLGLALGDVGFELTSEVSLTTRYSVFAAVLVRVFDPNEGVSQLLRRIQSGVELPTVHSILRLGNVDTSLLPVVSQLKLVG